MLPVSDLIPLSALIDAISGMRTTLSAPMTDVGANINGMTIPLALPNSAVAIL